MVKPLPPPFHPMGPNLSDLDKLEEEERRGQEVDRAENQAKQQASAHQNSKDGTWTTGEEEEETRGPHGTHARTPRGRPWFSVSCRPCVVVVATEGPDLLRDCARRHVLPRSSARCCCRLLPVPLSLSHSLRPGHRIGIRLRRSERGKLFPTKLESEWNRHARLPSLPPACNLTKL